MGESSLYHSRIINAHRDIFMRNHVNELVNEVKKNIENGITSLAIDFAEVFLVVVDLALLPIG